MRTTRIKNKLLQKFYKPGKSKIITSSSIKNFEEIEKFISEKLGVNKKSKKGDKKDNNDKNETKDKKHEKEDKKE